MVQECETILDCASAGDNGVLKLLFLFAEVHLRGSFSVCVNTR